MRAFAQEFVSLRNQAITRFDETGILSAIGAS